MGFVFDIRTIGNIIWRLLQFVGALVVIGMYGTDLSAANKAGKYSDGKWVFAVVIGSLSAVTSLAIGVTCVFIEYVVFGWLFAWEWILFFLWVVITGIFGKMYVGENPEMDNGIKRMQTAFGFDVACMLLWFLSAIVATWLWRRSDRRSLHTGRANLKA